MDNTKPPFDPNKPVEAIGGSSQEKPQFDPSKPLEPVGTVTQPEAVVTAPTPTPSPTEDTKEPILIPKRARELESQGISPDEAEKQAKVEFQLSIGTRTPESFYEQLQTGVARTFAGVQQTFYDMADALGVSDELGLEAGSELNKEVIKRLAEETRKYEEQTGQTGDIFTPANVGGILPTLSTAPVAYSTKTAAFLVEGSLAYAETRGTGRSETASLVTGMLAGIGTAGTMKVFDMLTDGGSKVLNEVIAEFDVADKTESIYKQYAKATGKQENTLTNYDKTTAILMQGKEKGAAYVQAAIGHDPKIREVITRMQNSKIRSVEGGMGTSKVDVLTQPLREQQAFASNSYNELKSMVFAKGDKQIPLARDLIVNSLEEISELQRSTIINRVLKKLKSDEPTLLSDLFDIREALSGVTIKARRVDKKMANTMEGGKYADSLIEANLPAEFKPLWGKLKDELRISYAMQGRNVKKEMNNVFGELLTHARDGERTYESILDSLANASGGPNKFKQLRAAVGSDKMVEFEKGLIREIYHNKNLNLGKTIDRLKHIGLITPEGKKLKAQLKAVDTAFSSDDFYSVVGSMIASNRFSDGASITANLLSKVKYSVAGASWSWLRQLSPFSQGQWIRHMKGVVKSINKSAPTVTELKKANPAEYANFERVVRNTIENTITRELGELSEILDTTKPKQLGHKPINPESPTMYGTEKGTIATSPSEAVLEENSKELFSRMVSENTQFRGSQEDVVKAANTVMESKRYTDILRSVQTKVKSDDLKQNAKVVANTIKREAENLISKVEKDLGIKMPQEEAQKLIKMKFEEIIRECK